MATKESENRYAQSTFSRSDMKEFGDWCRNALTNMEYSVSKLDEHLEKYISLKNKIDGENNRKIDDKGIKGVFKSKF